VTEADDSDDGALDDDGAGGTLPFQTLSLMFFGGGTLLLLPRQYWAAGIAMGVGAILNIIHRVRHKPRRKSGR
jgi:hypothetical protein